MRLTWVLLALFLSCCAAADDNHAPLQTELPQGQHPDAAESDIERATATLARLRPQIIALVTQLGSTEYRARQEAQAALREIGLPTVPALEEAANSTDAEVSHAAALLLESLRPSVSPITVSQSLRFAPRWPIDQVLEGAPTIAAVPKAHLLSVLKSLSSQTGFSFLAHPDLLAANPEVEIDGPRTLSDMLERIARSLQCAWVPRFGVFYLAKPATALELADAQVLSTQDAGGEKLLSLMTEKTVRISLRKTSLAKGLDFFTELTGVTPSFSGDVSPDTEISRFEVTDVSARDALSLLLFSLNLKARLSPDKITISKGDYSIYSQNYRSQQSLLESYRQAWKSLSPGSP